MSTASPVASRKASIPTALTASTDPRSPFRVLRSTAELFIALTSVLN
jgi:hypothetical protein